MKDIEKTFIEKNEVIFESFLGEGYEKTTLSLIFANIWQNRELLCILMGPNGDPEFFNFLKALVRNRTVDEWNREFPHYDREDLDFIFDFVFHGITSLLMSWIDNDRGISAEDFAKRMERLGHYALLAIKDFH